MIHRDLKPDNVLEIDADPQDWPTGCVICGLPISRCQHTQAQREAAMQQQEALSAATTFTGRLMRWWKRWRGW